MSIPPIKPPVYNLKSLLELLSNSGSILVEIPEKFTTKQKIRFRCNCGIEHIKTYAGIKKYGALCIECTKNQKVDKGKTTNSLKTKGVKRIINNSNKDHYAKRRKFTKETLNELLAESGASFQNIDDIPKNIGTKIVIKFVCKCGKNHEKQVRDFERTGAMCKDCSYTNKSQLVSIARTKVLEPINNTNTESRCKNCRNVYNNAYFIHNQSDDIDTNWCQICRNKKKIHNNILRNKRLISTCNDATKQKCTSCLMWINYILMTTILHVQ
jgi:hypothetical protein